MAATIIEPTDVIDCSSLSVLIYGPPGAWKTSLAQTADAPLTLDFDRGIHRAFNRKSAARFEQWSDVAEIAEGSPALQGKKTLVIDTVGRLLDLLAADIIAANPKHGSRAGGLSLQGYGALKSRFAHWISQVRLGRIDVVMIAHEKEEKDGDDRYMRPEVQGSSYTELMKVADLVGYLSLDRSNRRLLDFNPSDRHLGKNAAGWEPLAVPRLKDHPHYLADLLADAKARIGKTAEASAAVAKTVDAWENWLATDPSLDQFNAKLAELAELAGPIKKQVWHLLTEHAGPAWVFNKDTKQFAPKTNAA